jgi:transcription antitermination factor NusG
MNKLIFGILLLGACENSVQFEVPQPEGVKNESGIPSKLRGAYKHVTDSARLTITHNLIIKTTHTKNVFPKSELDSAQLANIHGDTSATIKDNSTIYFLQVKGDSARIEFTVYDTLFNALSGDVIRKFKGYYFINTELSNNNWNVVKLTKNKTGISLASINKSEEIATLRELTETASDTVYNFNPTKKQFRKFLKQKNFTSEDYYLKVNR